MDKKAKNAVKLLLGAVLLLLCVTAIVFWKTHVSKPAVAIKEVAKPREEKVVRPPKKVVLRSTIAGRWYPANADTLSKQIEGFFEKVEVEPIDNVIAFILPHAGYSFSGQTAAFGPAATSKKYKRIVIIGPSHRVPMEEVLSVPRATHYETPLGQIPLDLEFMDGLLEHSLFQNVPRAHRYEHSVQIELPLLQYTQRDFKLVPIVAGHCSAETIEKAGSILKSLVDDETLVVASSDFVHYGRNYGYIPFTENIPEQIKKLDMDAYEYIADSDSRGFLDYKRRTGATICGYIPIAILLSMLDEPTEVKLLKYTTSGEITGDFSNSVSYLSVAFCGTWRSSPPPRLLAQSSAGAESASELTEEDKKLLLVLARKSIASFLEWRKVPTASDLNVEVTEAMKEPRAAFVTLKQNSRLRGCTGDVFPRQPLYMSVISNAINAAVNDRRFLPVTKDQFDDIDIEISALTAPESVASSYQIRIGIDGVVLSKDGRSAVFLPQVATEQNWSLEQMLTQLSLKARLPADAWKQGASFLVFQAEVFGEDQK
jgi:AmmeMemoRadiSam system protein B/AmmeMemoRadiSam system protein A